MLTQTIEIQVNNPGLTPQINAIQADSGRALDCIITDMTIPAGATAQIYAQKPSGAKVFNTCSVSGRNVTVDLTTQILAELGRTMCQVQVMQGEEKVTSFDFVIKVAKSRVDSSAIESTDEFTALDTALTQANALLEDLANQPVAFTEAASNAYIASGDTVAELFGKIQKLFENVFELTPLKTIPSGADLNDYTDFGCWSVASATIAATVENGPITNSGYTLRVMRGGTGTNYIVQTALTGFGVSYFRTLTNTTWSDWEQVYSTKDIIPVSNGGTGRATLTGNTGLIHDMFPGNVDPDGTLYFPLIGANWSDCGYLPTAQTKTLLGMDNVFELNPTGTINANDDLNDYKKFGCWLCPSGTVAKTLKNCPVSGGGFTLRIMRGTSGNSFVQEIIYYTGDRFFRPYTTDGFNAGWKANVYTTDFNNYQGITIKKLWENANPASSFTNQTITLAALTEYDAVIIQFGNSTNIPDTTSYQIFVKNKSGYAVTWSNLQAQAYLYVRSRTVKVNAANIVFGDCYAHAAANQSASVQNGFAIPQVICGLKF